MYLKFLLLGSGYIFWWVDSSFTVMSPFIVGNIPDINIPTPTFLWLVFPSYIIFYLFILNLFSSLHLKLVPCK